MTDGIKAGTHRVFIFPDPRKGLKYRVEVKDGKVRVPLVAPVELFRIQDPDDPLNTLPVPEPPPTEELAPPPVGPPQAFNSPIEDVDFKAVDEAADSEGVLPRAT